MAHRIPWKAVAVVGVVSSGLGALALVTRKHAPVSSKRVALIGDSYAVGLRPELTKLLPTFKAAGVVGTNTAQWASHSTACGSCGDWLTTFKPDVVLVALGVNDGSAPNPTNYQTIVRALHGIGARVIWIEPPAGVDTPAVRDVIASLGVTTIPATPTPLAGDRLHPISYNQWAQTIAQAVS
jgi:hypothetical protein